MFKSKSSNLFEIAHTVDITIKPESVYRRFQRFFEKEMELSGIGFFCLDQYLNEVLAYSSDPKQLYLIIDRHHWKLGKTDHNLLVLYLYDPDFEIDFPIKVAHLRGPGNSGFADRDFLMRDVLEHIRPLIQQGRLMVTLLGDREFTGEIWEEFLGLHDLGYILRVRRDYRLPNGWEVGEVYQCMRFGEIREFRFDGWRLIIKRLKPIKGRRDDCLALVTLDMESEAESILRRYRYRWRIERGFFNMNSNGFDLQSTHLKHEFRVQMLFYLLSFCYFLSVICGLLVSRLKKVGIKKHGHRAISTFLLGFRTLRDLGIRSQLKGLYLKLLDYIDVDLLRQLNLLNPLAVNQLTKSTVV